MRWKSALATLALAMRRARRERAAAARASRSNVDAHGHDQRRQRRASCPASTVNVSSPAQVGGVQTSVTDSQGVYRFPALHPGVYELDATLSGFKTVKRGDITLTLGTTTTIDVTLSVASVSETVQVVGETPIVDIKSSASNTQLSDAVLQNLPTGRFQPDIINLTPGVAVQRRLRRRAELERAADGRRRRQRSRRRHAVVVLQLQLGRADSDRRARRQRRVRRVHRRRRQQHHPVGQQQGARSRRVPDRAQELGRRTTPPRCRPRCRRRSRRARSRATGTRPGRSASRSSRTSCSCSPGSSTSTARIGRPATPATSRPRRIRGRSTS